MKARLLIALWSLALVLMTQSAHAQCPPVAPTIVVPAGGLSVNEGSTTNIAVTGGGPVYEWDTDCDGVTAARGDTVGPTPFIFTAQNRDGADVSTICVRTVNPLCPAGMDRSPAAQSRVAIANVAPTVTTNVLISGAVGLPYRFTLAASDPANPPTAASVLDPIRWSAMGLPAGLMIDPMTGTISGTPGAGTAGNYMVTINVDDGDGGGSSRMLALTITAAAVVAACPGVNIGGGIGGALVVPEGGLGQFQGMLAAPSPGNCNCRIAWDFECNGTVDVIDGTVGISGVGRDGPVDAMRLCVAAIPTGACQTASPVTMAQVAFSNVRPTITTAALPSGTVGTGYVSQVVATDPANPGNTAGFRDPLGWAAMGLPPGLAINPMTGIIFGTPTMAGMFPVQFTVIDGDGGTHIVQITITINGAGGGTCPVPTINVNGGIGVNEGSNVVVTAALPAPNCGCVVEWDLGCDMVADGIGPNYTVVGVGRDGPSANLLCWRSVPSLAGACMTASALSRREVGYRNVAPTIVTMALPPGTTGVPYNFTVVATDPANPPIAMSVQDPITWMAANLPMGLMIDPVTGVISGTPTMAGCRDVQLIANDGDGGVTMLTLQLCINAVAPVVCSVPIPARELIAPEGGTATWMATLAVDCGCVINWDVGCDGMVDGTGGSFMFNAAGRDGPSRLAVCLTARPVAGGGCNAASATLLAPGGITNVAPTITTAMLSNGTEGVAYSSTVAATDPANPPIAMSVQDPLVFSLMGAPAWLMIDPMTGVISGTPPFGSAGMYTFTVVVNDGDGGQTTRMYTITIADAMVGDAGVVVDVPNVDVPAGADVPNADVPFVTDVVGSDVVDVVDTDASAVDSGVAMDASTTADAEVDGAASQDGTASADATSNDGRANGGDGSRADANVGGDGSNNVVSGDGACACRVVASQSTRSRSGLPALLAMGALATVLARRRRRG